MDRENEIQCSSASTMEWMHSIKNYKNFAFEAVTYIRLMSISPVEQKNSQKVLAYPTLTCFLISTFWHMNRFVIQLFKLSTNTNVKPSEFSYSRHWKITHREISEFFFLELLHIHNNLFCWLTKPTHHRRIIANFIFFVWDIVNCTQRNLTLLFWNFV